MLKQRWNKERALCPYCQSRFAIRLQRKWLLIEARQCTHCGLIYRWPTDAAADTRDFYETGYEGQQATDVPDKDALSGLVSRNFCESQYDKRERVKFLERVLGPPRGRALLDFGCSWGYSVRQYQMAGWNASGFELDRSRAAYGREKLGLDIRSGLDELGERRFDIILSDHSLEHVPQPGETLDTWARIQIDSGAVVIFAPNGSCTAARRLGVHWGPMIGEAHTVAFTMSWFGRNLARHGWKPAFFTSEGQAMPAAEYLIEAGELCVVGRRFATS